MPIFLKHAVQEASPTEFRRKKTHWQSVFYWFWGEKVRATRFCSGASLVLVRARRPICCCRGLKTRSGSLLWLRKSSSCTKCGIVVTARGLMRSMFQNWWKGNSHVSNLSSNLISWIVTYGFKTNTATSTFLNGHSSVCNSCKVRKILRRIQTII